MYCLEDTLTPPTPQTHFPTPLERKISATADGRQYFRSDHFWTSLPRWQEVCPHTFADSIWQERNAVTTVSSLAELLRDRVEQDFLEDLEEGFRLAPMAVRLTPYLLSLIDWRDPFSDPLRRQFLPLGSEAEPDHPLTQLDPIGEQADSPVPGITHRYPDRVLFLATSVCPVYCRYCTRSYAVGIDTPAVTKVRVVATGNARWQAAFEYITANQAIEDVVISGGDAYRLKSDQLLEIGSRLLGIPHVRRLRLATKGLAVMPMKILSDQAWTDAITHISDQARRMGKAIAIHTHFNHPSEITDFTARALNLLYSRHVDVRNQSVLLQGVNNDVDTLASLNRTLAYLNVRPYYCFQGDMIRGVESLRTSIADSIRLEKATRGLIAGYNTPGFIVDLPGGGGKRDVHSFEAYDADLGIAIYRAPAVKGDRLFAYCDPLRTLAPDVQARWMQPNERNAMLSDVRSRCS